jgi:hypothetical protein
MLTDLKQFLEPFVLGVAALLPIVNPLGGAPSTSPRPSI